MRIGKRLATLLVVAGACAQAAGQSSPVKNEAGEVLRRLLEETAPVPRTPAAGRGGEGATRRSHPPEFYDGDRTPAAAAPDPK